MKRWFRPVAYSVILVLAVLAIFGDEAPADVSALVMPRASATSSAQRQPVLPSLRQREAVAFPTGLFVADPAPAPLQAPPAEPAVPPAPAEIKVLGWMLFESVPNVFVEWNNDSYSLKPTESLDDAYRFDGIDGGFADFTYLPTGETRQYVVSDPALLE